MEINSRTVKVITLTAALCLISHYSYSQSTLSLIAFKGNGIASDIVHSIEERIESHLPGYCQCAVVSQEELDGTMLALLNKQAARTGERYQPGPSGSRISVDKIVTGTLSKVGPSYSLVLKLIEVNTGVIERSVSREHSGSIEALLQFTDATVASLFEETKPQVRIDTLFVPVTAQTATSAERQQERKVIQEPVKRTGAVPESDEKADRMMEKISIGAIAIFASIAVILLSTTTR